MEPLTTNAGEETDITPNRAYSESYGRWLSPDPGGLKVVKLEDPQTRVNSFQSPSALSFRRL